MDTTDWSEIASTLTISTHRMFDGSYTAVVVAERTPLKASAATRREAVVKLLDALDVIYPPPETSTNVHT